MKHKKRALFQSVISLILCFSMLVGTTFAWFTDSVSSGTNMIAAGSLDIELDYLAADGTWKPVDADTEVLDKDALWEPGYTEVAYLRITNAGTLALKYALGIGILSETGSVNAAGEAFKLSDYIEFGVVESETAISYADRAAARNALSETKYIHEGYGSTYSMKNKGDVRYIALVVYMPESVGNAANYATGQNPPEIELGIELVATQEVHESDSFGSDYDTNAELPGFTFPENVFGDSATEGVTTDDDNKVAEGITIQGSSTNAVIPAGVQLEEGAEALTLEVTSMNQSNANITLGENDAVRSLNVHVEGVSADNTVPMEITIREAAAIGLNAGNLKLYHVENGTTVEMTAVDTFTAHNQFKYDPATGDIILYMATFSEVAVVADTENAWNGKVDTSWYSASATTMTIANADHLAGLGNLVSGGNNFSGKTIKLVSDVNMGGEAFVDGNGKLKFYPIGYTKEGYKGSFSGTFDGTGHIISNIFQNTWMLEGTYAGTYYNAAMGLFGYVDGGTVKNLTIDNFKSEGEYAPTGCVAAYAANAIFENIAITNSHPATYNTSVAAVVGRDGKNGSNGNNGYNLIFRNITVDSTNTVSALWGSWDVGAAGILGYLGSDSKVLLENCRVSPTIDVYNDVCGNYQYYWYRYCGMLIGTVDKTKADGSLDLSNITANNCTVDFGDRHEYYYCEFVENSIASYTHDYQFSRVDKKDIVGSGESATCQNHNHEEHGKETVDGVEVLVEDKQAVYIPFRQIFGGYGWGVDGKEIGELLNIQDVTSKIEPADQVKFASKFTGDFLYRVGNKNTVSVGSLFAAKDDKTINNSGVHVTIDKVDENANISGTFTANTSDWTQSTIQFSGTGLVKITIQDYNYCTPTELIVEVVDAVNATSATSATKNNVVLLDNCGFSSLEVSGGYTLYGNGFTMTCGSDSAALDMGYSFVTLNNGTLDNVQIVCPNFDYAVLYKSNMTESGNRKETDTSGKTRYFNVKSGVMASGNSQILNSRISGGRAAVNVSGGNVVIDNSRIELGAVATVLVGSANSLTLRDVTLVQKPTASTHDSSKKLMGFSVLVMCTSGGNAAPITLEGELIQNAWVDETDKEYVPEDAQTIIDTVMEKDGYLHDIDGDGTNESLNLGIAYMPADGEYTVNKPSITDNRSNKATIPYNSVEVKYSYMATYVYSYENTNGTDESTKKDEEYTPDTQSDIVNVTYSDTAEGLTAGKSYGTDGWVYELNVDLDKLPGYALDFSKLSMSVNGVNVTEFTVNGNAKPTSPVAVTAGGTTYILIATVNDKEYTANYKVTGTETSKESPSLVASNYEAGLCVASSYGGTWSGAAPALEGIQIRYWSVAEKQYKTINLSDYTPTTTGKLNGTNTTWTYSPDNGDFTLTLTGGQVHSGNSVNAMPVVCDGKLYFVAASSKGLVNTGNSARAIPVSYTFKDNNNGDELTFSHTWSVAENKDAQYKYSDFCDGMLTKLENCITPDTLITLADGSHVRVDSLTGTEELLVWNMETGKLDSAPILFVDSDPEAEFEIVHLYFSDGTDVKVIYEHGFWDYDLNKYVYLDANADKYIGHTFAKRDGSELTQVKLTAVVLETEVTTAWSPVTEGHLCYFVNGMLSMPGGVGGLFNIFAVDPETMTYDFEVMQRDIETYGLFTYEELNAIEPLSREMFNAAGGAYLKVSIGKGNLTMDELRGMIRRYSKFFD